jgi:hypothetical protein
MSAYYTHMLENLLNDSVYSIFKNSSFNDIILTSKIISVSLAAIVAAFAYRFYTTLRSPVLLGIMLSFGFMSVTDVFIILIQPEVDNLILFNMFFWLRLVTMSLAFTFLALTYYTSSGEGKRSKMIAIKYTGLSSIPVFSIIFSAWFFDSDNLPAFTQYDEYFGLYNVCALGFVFIKLLKNSKSKKVQDVNSLLLAYGILWMGQISLLVCSLGGNSSIAIAAFFAKDVGLAIFAIMQFHGNRRKPVLKELKHPEDFR